MEDGKVTVSRAVGTLTFPAKFILVAASNPCPCGFHGDPVKKCRCFPGQILRYQKKISGPIIDRIDLHLEVPAVEVDKLTRQMESRIGANRPKISVNRSIESSKGIQKRVQAARNMQTKRFKGTKLTCNAELGTRQVKKFCLLSDECQKILRQAVSQFHLSARAYYRLIKVARTIADLAGEKEIGTNNIAEALQYKPKMEE